MNSWKARQLPPISYRTARTESNWNTVWFNIPQKALPPQLVPAQASEVPRVVAFLRVEDEDLGAGSRL